METQRTSAFGALEPTPRSHFSILFYSAIYCLIDYLYHEDDEEETLDDLFGRHPFLARYFGEMVAFMPDTLTWEEGRLWWQEEVAQWEAQTDLHLPLRALFTGDPYGFQSRIFLLLAGLGEEDSRFGDLYAALQRAPAQRRPSMELLGQIVLARSKLASVDGWYLCKRLLALGLLQVINKEASRAEWVLRTPPLLWDLLRGEEAPQVAGWCHFEPPHSFPQLEEMIFPAAFRQQLQHTPRLIESGQAGVLLLRGMPGSEQHLLMGAIARSLGKGILSMEGYERAPEIEQRQIGPICTMLGAWPVLVLETGPGETVKLPPLPGYTGPVGVILGMEGGLESSALEKTISLTLPVPSAEERCQIWRQAFGIHPVVDLDQISTGFRLPGDYIRQVAPLAVTQAALAGEEAVRPGHVRAACRTLNRQMLDSLAVCLDGDGRWDQLVVNEVTMARLWELERRCRHREALPAQLGAAFSGSVKRGVSALLTGVSGTGKTFAARILAAELQMDLYRVDLAAIVNKYIGETEKNLNRVLSYAEALDVILLLDEGDALLGSRTEVRSSNDRYANLETDYLLQRLENYQGIVIITTNTAEYIDNAFQRRIDVVVPFVPPDAEERWHIWSLHLPPTHVVTAAFLEEISTRCTLTGGQIRNGALHAALLALDAGVPLDNRHLRAAVQSEYRKAGATDPLRSHVQSSQTGGSRGMANFLQAMTNGNGRSHL
jgi:hypothetical protein